MTEREREWGQCTALLDVIFLAGFSGNEEVMFGLRCKRNDCIALITESGTHFGSCIYVFITPPMLPHWQTAKGWFQSFLIAFHSAMFDRGFSVRSLCGGLTNGFWVVWWLSVSEGQMQKKNYIGKADRFEMGEIHGNMDSCWAVGSSHLTMQRLCSVPKFGIRKYNLGHLL